MIIRKGMSDITTYFKLVNPFTGVPETGLVVSDLDLTYVRDRGTAVKADMLELAAANSTHSDIKGYEVDGTNCPGLLRVDWPDAAFADGANRVQLCINGANIDPAYIEVELVDVDFGNATDMGLATLSDLIADTGTDIPATLTAMTGTLSDIVADTGTTIPATLSDIYAGISDLVFDAQVISDIDTNVDSIVGKLPNNYIMGSSDQTDHDDEIASILVDTGAISDIDANVDTILGHTGTTIPATLSDIYAGVSDILFDAQIMSDIDANVDSILASVAVVSDIDANVDTILASVAVLSDIDINVDSIVSSVSDIVADTGTDIPAAIATIDTVVSDILGDTAATIPALITALNDPTVSEIWTYAMTDIAQGAPSSTASVLKAINYLYEAWRNKTTTTATLMTVFKDDGTTGLVKSTIGDDGTTFTKGELISGA